MPKQEDLRVGQYYFRFADQRWGWEQQVSGSWWVDYENLIKMARFARDHATPREAVQYLILCPTNGIGVTS